jgi:hypothetical protein
VSFAFFFAIFHAHSWRVSSLSRPVAALRTQIGNRRRSSAKAETTGYWLASHRAADSQPRCRLR